MKQASSRFSGHLLGLSTFLGPSPSSSDTTPQGRQYQRLMDMHGVPLEFTDGALKAVARAALRRGTGARGLRTLLEKLLTEAMFEVPDAPGVVGVVVDEESVEVGLGGGWAGSWGMKNPASGSNEILVGGARLIFRGGEDESAGFVDADADAAAQEVTEEVFPDDFPREATV